MFAQGSIGRVRLFMAFFVFVVLFTQLLLTQSAFAQSRVLIGLIPEMNIFKQKQRFKLLGEYLTKKTGVPIEYTILRRYGNIIESFTAEKMDGAFFGSFTGSHDAAIIAVLDGKADIGAAKHSIYDWVKKDNPRIEKELTIIARSPSVPSNGLCVRNTLDAGLQAKLKEALLHLGQDPADEVVLAKYGALKFIETTTEDYQPVFDMAKNAGIDMKTYDYRNE